MLQTGQAGWDPAHSPLEAASADLDRPSERDSDGRRMTASMRRRVAWNPSPFASASAQNGQLGNSSRAEGAQDDDAAQLPAAAAQVPLRWGPAAMCREAWGRLHTWGHMFSHAKHVLLAGGSGFLTDQHCN